MNYPPEIERIPIQTLPAPALAKLERLYLKLLKTLSQLRKATPEVCPEYERANACWQRIFTEQKRRALVAAQREEVLWTTFIPHSFGTQEVITTPHYTITHWWHTKFQLFGPDYRKREPGTAQKRFRWLNPWQEFRETLAKPSAPGV